MGRDLQAFAREAEQEERAKYLLCFCYLQDRLCRAPVPDAGARLEDLLIRLRRPLGRTVSQWSNEVQEAYRKVQRALVRARKMEPKKDLMKAILERRCWLSRSSHTLVISASGTATRTRTPVQEGEPVDEEEVARDPHEAEQAEEWKDEEWEDGRKFLKWRQQGVRRAIKEKR